MDQRLTFVRPAIRWWGLNGYDGGNKLTVGAMLEAQTPNTVELANGLPLETSRQDMREQGLRW
ncbi:MAG: hypothetical protein ACFCVA_18160 [Gammaproteobacteria bacterium]